jgi:hypothetical protein
MTEVLAMVGRMMPAALHPPLVRLPPHEIARLLRTMAISALDRDAAASAAPLAAE